MAEITAADAARYALYFAAENETFPVFKAWVAANHATLVGHAWGESMTLDSLRTLALELHEEHAHG